MSEPSVIELMSWFLDRTQDNGVFLLVSLTTTEFVKQSTKTCKPTARKRRTRPHTAVSPLMPTALDVATYLTRIIHAPLSSRWSPPKMRRHVCYQAPDERCSSLNRSGVIRFHVSALCQVLSRAASRRTGILVRHDHHGSNEVEPTWRRAIKAIGTVPCLIDSPAP